MAYGDQANIYKKNIKDIIVWTKNLVMEYTNGKTGGYTREILIMICVMDLASSMTEINLFTEVFGETDNRLISR